MVNMQPQIVVIGVCTYKRPNMLRACLDSLTQQLVSPDIFVTIVVVDNEPTSTADVIVDEFGPITPIPIYYVHEPIRGIAAARNAVLETALDMEADWIAFIDDDEVAEPDWIAALMAERYRFTPVLRGRRIHINPNNSPFWALPPKSGIHKEGKVVKSASTCNIRFSRQLLDAGLRFDERLGISGGEDIDFFSRASAMGFEIKCTNHAVTHEFAHADRLTFRGQFYREFCSGATSGQIRGSLRLLGALLVGIVGAAEMTVSPFFALGGMLRFKRRALSGSKKIAKACGRLAAFIGVMPTPYRNVVGN